MTGFGGRVLSHGTIDSTNERALAAIAAGEAQHGDWHIAEGQTSGRGRRGSTWESPAGEGLFASVVLLPPPGSALRPPALTMAAGLGVLNAVWSFGNSHSRLKWPNDVLVNDAKLAGILVESRGFNPDQPHFVVGIGLNVRQRQFPPQLVREREVTSLALLHMHVTIDQAFKHLRPDVEAWLGQALDPSPESAHQIEMNYLSALDLGDSRVSLQVGQELLHGVLEGLSIQNGIRMRTETGDARTIPLEHVAQLSRR